MPRLVKRYENRKLYDMTAKNYVTLEELARLIRQGEEIQVVENATGEDVTVQILAKIISEEGRQGSARFPNEFLHDVVRWGGQVMNSGRDWTDQQLDRVVSTSLKRQSLLSALGEQLNGFGERLRRIEEKLGMPAPEPDPPPAEAAAQDPEPPAAEASPEEPAETLAP